MSTESNATKAPEPSPRVMGTRRLRMVRPVCAACASISPSVVLGRKISGQRLTHQIGADFAQKFLDGAGGHHQAAVAAEHQTASSSWSSRRSKFPRRSEKSNCAPRNCSPSRLTLVAMTPNSSAPVREHRDRAFGIVLALGHQIEHVAQASQGAEGDDGKQQGNAERAGERSQCHAGTLFHGGHDIERLDQRRIDDHTYKHLGITGRAQGLLELVGSGLV